MSIGLKLGGVLFMYGQKRKVKERKNKLTPIFLHLITLIYLFTLTVSYFTATTDAYYMDTYLITGTIQAGYWIEEDANEIEGIDEILDIEEKEGKFDYEKEIVEEEEITTDSNKEVLSDEQLSIPDLDEEEIEGEVEDGEEVAEQELAELEEDDEMVDEDE